MTDFNRSIPVIVISGFLGAGKTSLVNHLLRTGLSDKRLAVIVNDFGKLPVDASLIRRHGPDVIELSNGCVCCSVQVGLLQAIDRVVRQHNADLIVLECSGISDTRQLLDLLKDPTIPAHVERVVTLVDARRFLRQHERFVLLGRQIEPADLLIVNHCDEADTATVEQTCELLRQLRPEARIITTSHAQIETDVLLKKPESFYSGDGSEAVSDTRSEKQSWYKLDISLRQPIDPQRVREVLTRLNKDLLRAKGFIRWDEKVWCVQLSGPAIDIQPISGEEWSSPPGVEGELVLIADRPMMQQVKAIMSEIVEIDVQETELHHELTPHAARPADTSSR